MKIPKPAYSFLQLSALVVVVTLIICATMLTMNDKSIPEFLNSAGFGALGLLFGLPLAPHRDRDERTRDGDDAEVFDASNAG